MAKSPNPPPLPPRPNMDTFSELGKTPPAWLCALIRHNSGEDNNNQHKFYLSTEFDGEYETVFLCQECHSWFHLTTTAPGQAMCSISENNLHHLHTKTISRTTISANCCLCDFVVDIKIKEPFIDMRIFDKLAKLRRKHTYANAVKYNDSDFEPTMDEVLDIMKKIVDSVLDDDLQALEISRKNFEIIGVDEASQAVFEKLGFILIDDRLIPPDSLSKRDFRLVKEELRMLSLGLNSLLKYDEKKPYDKLNFVLGTTYKQRSGTCTNFDPESGPRSSQPSSFLGCVSDMDDQTLIWAYKLGITDSQEKASEYLQAIYDMSKERNSEALEELVALESSLGKFHEEDIRDAYKSLGCRDDVSNISDQHLIELFAQLSSEHPSSRAEYEKALIIVGKSRKSAGILHFLNKEGLINETFDSSSPEMPVGLDNIGNTCYLNSLLQYYFTVRKLRKAVLKTDLTGANGYELDWRSITIGHRKVSKSEIERAKKFVSLLQGLFVNLISTSERSISPDMELAYLALVNAKNDEEEYKETSKSPMDLSSNSYDNKMAIDSSPGPSDNYTVSEEETVEMEGTAPSANDFSESNASKGKHKEQTYGPEPQSDYFKEDKFKAASDMLFGRQQDVTECMDNVMFQLEAAFKSLYMFDENGYEQNIIESLFHGQTKQILHKEQSASEPLTKEESFNHLIVVVAEGRDLYDGLDVYFDESLVDYDGTQVIREVTLSKIPPILQIHVQRVQFDRTTSNIYKSNAFLRFDKVIYLDRYLEKNYELLKRRREEAHGWKEEIDRLQAELKDYEQDRTTMLPTIDLLKSTADFIHDMKNDILLYEDFDFQLSKVEREANRINVKIEEYNDKILRLKSKLKTNYEDLRECEYRLHAVFIHNGQANFGHYWIYIFDFEKNRWLKYNDSYVTEVGEHEVFADTTGSSANPYCMVYVRAKDAKELVETVFRQTN